MQTDINTAKYHTDRAKQYPGLNPIVIIKFLAPGTWSILWDEPRTLRQWEQYPQAGRADMLPAIGAYFDAWKVRAPLASRNAFFYEGVYSGSVKRVDEGTARDLVAIIRHVFPDAVVTWPKGVQP